jgi:glycosyltransferase involved in cell wall biosynthesis
MGTDTIVITRHRINTSPKFENLDGISIYRIWPSGLDRLGKYFMMIPAFIKLIILTRRFDCIYVCGIRTLGIIAVVYGKIFHKPVVLRSESLGEFAAPDILTASTNWVVGAPLRFYVAIRNGILKNADRFIAICQEVADEYKSGGIVDEKVEIVYNGIDVETFKPRDKQELRGTLGLPEARKVFTYTGKLNKGKGLEMLLRVWEKFSAEHSNVFLVLVGGGGFQFLNCEVELREFVKTHNLEDSVLFTGYTEDVVSYLCASDFFVLPSDSEAHSISILEAMACGLPTIATETGGVNDYMEHGKNGFMIPIGDEAALLDVMRSLIAAAFDVDLVSQNARRCVVENFSISTIAQQHQDLFNSLN